MTEIAFKNIDQTCHCGARAVYEVIKDGKLSGEYLCRPHKAQFQAKLRAPKKVRSIFKIGNPIP